MGAGASATTPPTEEEIEVFQRIRKHYEERKMDGAKDSRIISELKQMHHYQSMTPHERSAWNIVQFFRSAEDPPESLECSELQEVLPNIYMIHGNNRGYPLTMVLVKVGDELVMINSLRADDNCVADFEAIGDIKHIIRLGSAHGKHDAYYIKECGAKVYMHEDMNSPAKGVTTEEIVYYNERTTDLPIPGAKIFCFSDGLLYPECMLLFPSERGNVLVTSDLCLNMTANVPYVPDKLRETEFCDPGTIGPMWRKKIAVENSDLKTNFLPKFKEVFAADWAYLIPGHGEMMTGKETYRDGVTKVLGESPM